MSGMVKGNLEMAAAVAAESIAMSQRYTHVGQRSANYQGMRQFNIWWRF
jgi:hypothetical protein